MNYLRFCHFLVCQIFLSACNLILLCHVLDLVFEFVNKIVRSVFN